MKKAGKVILITAAVLLLIGLLLLIAALASNHWDFSAVVGGEYRSRTVRLEEAIRDISIRCGTEDVRFVQSEDGVCSVEFYERENEPHSAAVLDGTLTVTVEDQREWYQRITLLSFERPSITVHLPRSKYAALHIENSTGAVEIPGEFRFDSIELSTDTGSLRCGASALEQIRISGGTGSVRLEELSAKDLTVTVSTGAVDLRSVECGGHLQVDVSTGRVSLADLRCASLRSEGSTGDLYMKNVVAVGLISVERSTGDIRLEKCDAGELSLETDTGDVTGSLLSEKIFVARSDTGSVDVPDTVNGGKCRITTDTGSIRVTIR